MIDNNFPFSTLNNKGEWIGFEADLARNLCQEMQRKCIFVKQDWDLLIPGLIEKQYDAIISSLSITKERKQQVAFSKHYYSNGAKFIRKKNTEGKVSYKSLANTIVGVKKDSIAERFLNDKFVGVIVKSYSSLSNAYAALTNNEVNMVFADKFLLHHWIKENKSYEMVGPSYSLSKYFKKVAVAVRQEDSQLREAFNLSIEKSRKSGHYKTIRKKYFPFSIYGR